MPPMDVLEQSKYFAQLWVCGSKPPGDEHNIECLLSIEEPAKVRGKFLDNLDINRSNASKQNHISYMYM